MKIIIWTGPAWEPWDPDSLNTTGIGGSETATIHMAKELALLQHEVVVVGDHADKAGIYHYAPAPSFPLAEFVPIEKTTKLSVRYINYQRALEDPKLLECDVLVASRDKQIVRKLAPKCRVKVLWVHDIHVGDDWDNDLPLYDRIYCLSNWHRDYFFEKYPHVEPEKLKLTRNGIDIDRFEPNMSWAELRKKKKPSFVYSSSPDRGLDVMLDVWPAIREMRGDAELHVYYGFLTMRKLNEANKRGLAICDYFETRVKSMSHAGVTYHGRVGQKELAQAHLAAMVWCYPTAFLETSCITAMEAQMAGAIPVTTKIGALPETVRAGTLLDPPNKSPRYRKEFLETVKRYLREWDDEDFLATMCPTDAFLAREYARNNLPWSGVAREWSEDFEELYGQGGR